MKVKVITTGEVKHVPNDLVTTGLLRIGIIEEIKPEPPAPGNAVWEIWNPDKDGLSAHSQLTIKASCSVCGQKIWGAPAPNLAAVSKFVFWHCGRGQNVPKDVAEDWVKRGGGARFPTGHEGVQPDQEIT